MNQSSLLRSAIKLRGSLEITVFGESMAPSLLAEERVRLIPAGNPCIGTLVAFPGRRSGAPVLHRLVTLDTMGYTAVGDNGSIATKIGTGDLIGVASHLFSFGQDNWCEIEISDEALQIACLSAQIANLSERQNVDRSCTQNIFDDTHKPVIAELHEKRMRACQKWRLAITKG